MSCNQTNRFEKEKCIWSMLEDNYCRAYAKEKINPGSSTQMSDRFMAQLEDKAAKILQEEGELLGMSIENGIEIDKARNKLKNLKTRYEERGENLNKYIDLNQANNPRKVDTLDKKSRAYLTTSFYTISILTMSFFIYKQLKE